MSYRYSSTPRWVSTSVVSPTAICELELEAIEDLFDASPYDLSGRRIDGARTQGVIIRNGKKIVR